VEFFDCDKITAAFSFFERSKTLQVTGNPGSGSALVWKLKSSGEYLTFLCFFVSIPWNIEHAEKGRSTRYFAFRELPVGARK